MGNKCSAKNDKANEMPKPVGKEPLLKPDGNFLAQNVYGIKKFGPPIFPNQELKAPLKFEFRLSNFKCSMLKDNMYYILKIDFAKQKVFLLPVASGSNPKFSFEDQIRMSIAYDKMETTYMELLLYNLPSSTDIFQFSKVEDMIQKASFYSSLKVDLLTIAIGPEHHDIVLLEPKKATSPIGRISYNVSCNHIANVSLNIESIKFNVSHLQNKVALKLKFRDTQIQKESDFTELITSKTMTKEEIPIYEWSKPQPPTDIKGKAPLTIERTLSMLELRSADASMNFYAVRLVDIEDAKQDKDNLYLIDPKSAGNLELYMPLNIEEASNSGKKPELKLVPQYSKIGSANLNFYQILTPNDDAIVKQTSMFFLKISRITSNYPDSKNTKENLDPITLPLRPLEEPIKFQVFEQVSQTVEENIVLNDKHIGKMNAKVVIKNIPLIRQIMCGVLTERGFDLNSVHCDGRTQCIQRSLTSKDQERIPNDLKLLISQKTNLENEILKKPQLKTLTQSEKDFNAQILAILQDIKSTLVKSTKETCLYYGYSGNPDLYKGQRVLIDLGINMLEMIEKMTIEQRAVGFEILKTINERAEFHLGTLFRTWFIDIRNESGEYLYSTFMTIELLELKIIESFLAFNNNCLKFSLDRLSRGKNIDKECRNFVEYFLSVAYFRIPIFRSNFLNIISSNIEQGSECTKERLNSIEEFIELDPVNSLIFWDNLFYTRLKSALKNNQTSNEIQEKLKETEDINSQRDNVSGWGDWRERLSKRDQAFFSMVKQLEKYIQNKAVKTLDIKWSNIPGFDKIIDALYYEINTREVRMLPNQLMDLIPVFVNNSIIVNTIVRKLIERTNVYDVNAVYNIVTILDSLFREHEKRKQISNFVQKFDYTLLRQAMKAIIKIDHSLCVSKFIWLYYRNAHIMNLFHFAEVWNDLISNGYFYKLFFHWSWQVRNMFFYFVIFIVGYRLKYTISWKDFIDIRNIRWDADYDSNELHNTLQMKQHEIIESLDNQMKVIPIIKKIIKEENLDPTFKNQFDNKKYPDLKDIPKEVHKRVVVSMHHYETIEKEYDEWEGKYRKRKNSEIEYPDILIVPPKDDVVEYSADSW